MRIASGLVDWTLFHAVNSTIATRDWLEDPTTALAGVIVPLYALATVGLWFLARPYGPVRWKLASASALVSAAVVVAADVPGGVVQAAAVAVHEPAGRVGDQVTQRRDAVLQRHRRSP